MTNGALPDDWAVAPLSDLCEVVMGQSPPSTTYNEAGDGLPFFQGKAEFTDLFPVVRKWCSAPAKVAEADDILLSVRAPVGPTNIAPLRCCIGRGLAALRPRGGISHRYVLYGVRASEPLLAGQGTGTTFDAVSGNQVRAFTLPLAPVGEQRRIVEKIEELFSMLDAGVAALERVRANLKRYRAAVLKAAVEGRLTEEWRAKHPDTEPASVLLDRILQDRRHQREQDQLAKFAEKGHKPPAGWQARYKAPEPPDTADLPELPEGWAWGFGSQLFDWSSGKSLPKQHQQGGDIPVYGGNGIQGYHDKPLLTRQTVVIGRVGVYCGNVYATSGPAWVTDNAIYATTIPAEVPVNYLRLALLQTNLNQKAQGGAQPFVNQPMLNETALPLPPVKEQAEIVAEVERRLSVVEEIERETETGLKRAARLRQSILKRAFEGRLVPQDPNDEPASALLERIKSEREANSPVPRRARTGYTQDGEPGTAVGKRKQRRRR